MRLQDISPDRLLVIAKSKSVEQMSTALVNVAHALKYICPECRSSDVEKSGPYEVTGIETYVKHCQACGHTWDPE